MSDPLPTTLGRYQIEAEIGRGMMGQVYRALDPVLGRAIALKTVRLAFSVPEAERSTFEKRFLAEARAAASLSHPGIVVVHDVGRDPDSGVVFIALELLPGRSLAETMAGGAPLDWREALRITARLAEALHHAHAHGIVHRDVKPANVMLLPSGQPKIMDFGIAKVPASQLTAVGEFFGTPLYMSPEQVAGEPLDGRSDLFSLGAMLYLLLTGRAAFDAPTLPSILARVAQQEPVPPSRLRPEIPAAVDAVVARALAKKKEDRYPDGHAFTEDLEDVLAGRQARHAPPAVEEGQRTVASAGGSSGRVAAEAPSALPTVTVAAAPVPASASSGALSRSPAATASRRALRAALSWRGAFVLGLMLLAAAMLAYVTLRGDRGLGPLSSPAHLEIDVEHSMKSGSLKVWVDDDQVLDEALESRVTRKILSFRMRKGSLNQVLDVAPGEHVVRVQVEGDYNGSRRIRGTFESGATRRLVVRIDGLIKKDLSLVWGS